MYPAGVSARRIKGVSETLWGAGASAGTVPNPNEKAFESVDAWRTGPLSGGYPYLFVDGGYLKRSWGGSYENVAVMVASAWTRRAAARSRAAPRGITSEMLV